MEILVGLECVPIEGAPETIDYFKQMGTKIHMLSADTKEKCVRACYQLNVFNSVKDNTTYYLDFTDKFSGETQIKPIIEELNQTVQALNLRPEHGDWQILKTQDSRVASETLSRFLHLVLVVSSSCLDYINSDTYFREHFMFCLEFTKSVVVYDC